MATKKQCDRCHDLRNDDGVAIEHWRKVKICRMNGTNSGEYELCESCHGGLETFIATQPAKAKDRGPFDEVLESVEKFITDSGIPRDSAKAEGLRDFARHVLSQA